ncbi:unnamed protein product [Closterium sp. NIES-64]|nr:unnamed protein product [Closterium sp. NIES-64]
MSGVEGFAINPEYEEGSDTERRYRSPVGCDWFRDATAATRERGMSAAWILILCDATHLIFNDRQMAHPVLFSLLNIPERLRWMLGGTEMVALFPPMPAELTAEEKTAVFQTMVDMVFGPLMQLPKKDSEGVRVVDHEGKEYNVVPMLAIYACDHTESNYVTCTMSATSLKPCSICSVNRWQLAKFDGTVNPCLRTIAGQADALSMMARASPAELPRVKHAYSTHFVKCALWESEYLDTPWGNLYCTIGVCVLHVVDEGVWLHAMRRYGLTPSAMCRYVPPSSVMCRYVPHSSAMCRYVPPSSAMCRYVPPSSAMCRYVPPSSAMCRYVPPSFAMCRYVPPSSAMCRYVPPSFAVCR